MRWLFDLMPEGHGVAWTALLLFMVVPLVPQATDAHVGGVTYLIPPVLTRDLPDVRDDVWDAWAEVPTVRCSDLQAPSGEGPDEEDCSLSLLWWPTGQWIYGRATWRDDHYVGPEVIEIAEDFASVDRVQIMVDGDHSGGMYSIGSSDGSGSELPLSAQVYSIVPEDGQSVALLGDGGDWAQLSPFVEGAGTVTGSTDHQLMVEFHLTPMDVLGGSPETSRASVLWDGKIIGFQLAVFDVDGETESVYSLFGQKSPWSNTDQFVDGVLVPCGDDCIDFDVVMPQAWGRIKAAVR